MRLASGHAREGAPTSVRRSVDRPRLLWNFAGASCAVLKFLRDKSRAPAAILVGPLNTCGSLLPLTPAREQRLACLPGGSEHPPPRQERRHALDGSHSTFGIVK